MADAPALDAPHAGPHHPGRPAPERGPGGRVGPLAPGRYRAVFSRPGAGHAADRADAADPELIFPRPCGYSVGRWYGTGVDMPTATSTIAEFANQEYKHGFFTEIEADTVP